MVPYLRRINGWYLVALVCLGHYCLLVLLDPPFWRGALLLFLVIVRPNIPLVQLFLQVMVLLGKAKPSRGPSNPLAQLFLQVVVLQLFLLLFSMTIGPSIPLAQLFLQVVVFLHSCS